MKYIDLIHDPLTHEQWRLRRQDLLEAPDPQDWGRRFVRAVNAGENTDELWAEYRLMNIYVLGSGTHTHTIIERD